MGNSSWGVARLATTRASSTLSTNHRGTDDTDEIDVKQTECENEPDKEIKERQDDAKIGPPFYLDKDTRQFPIRLDCMDFYVEGVCPVFIIVVASTGPSPIRDVTDKMNIMTLCTMSALTFEL